MLEALALSGIDRECEFFRVGVVDGVFLSEDFYFCRDAAAFGFESRILDASTAHIGTIAYEHRGLVPPVL